MDITCQNCVEVLDRYLCDIPFQWRRQIARAICDQLQANNPSKLIDCDDIKNCETITTLSAFSSDGTNIDITFTNEGHKQYKLKLDLTSLLDVSLDGIDPMCLLTQEAWDAMSNKERIERIINTSCC